MVRGYLPLETIYKMHPTPKGFVAPPSRDLTSLFMNTWVFVKPIQTTRISRQDAAPTAKNEMWEWLPATNN
jgi:hypothetical protein